MQGGMRVSWFSAAHEGSGKAERSCELSAKAGGDEAMWRTWLTRVAQAAGVVQAGVGQTGRRGAGGRAAGGGLRHLLLVCLKDEGGALGARASFARGFARGELNDFRR